MKIDSCSLPITFKMNCIKPESWNKEVLKVFEQSNIVKEIDKKYPKASANYFFFEHYKESAEKDIPQTILRTLLFDINLAPKKIWHCRFDSDTKEGPIQKLINEINSYSLANIESDIATGITRYSLDRNKVPPKTSSFKSVLNTILGYINISHK